MINTESKKIKLKEFIKEHSCYIHHNNKIMYWDGQKWMVFGKEKIKEKWADVTMFTEYLEDALEYLKMK